MIRFVLIGIAVGFQIYALVEAAGTKSPRTMSRWAWVLITGVVPILGPILWFWGGRPTRRLPPPDDNPNFLRDL
jgi:hypothetical protein